MIWNCAIHLDLDEQFTKLVKPFHNTCNKFFDIFISVGAFYFTIGNIHPKFRSRVHSIQLVALVKAAHIKLYGMNKILEPIVKDIQKLVSLVVSNSFFIDGHYLKSKLMLKLKIFKLIVYCIGKRS